MSDHQSPSVTDMAEAICAIVRAALPEAIENTKWNAPNFSVEGQDLITLNFPPKGGVRVVLHRGATAKDTKTGQRLLPDESKSLVWATDQRASVSFSDLSDVNHQSSWLAELVQRWVVAASKG